MAEGDLHPYRSFKKRLMDASFNLGSDTIKCALVSGYTLDEDVHDVWADISANEITDASYSAQDLASLAVTSTGTGTGTACKGKWDAADVTFSSLTGTDPNYLILYDDTLTGTIADSLILAGELTTVTNGGDYQIAWHTNGIIRIS